MFPDATTSQPHRAVVVSCHRDRQFVALLVTPCVEPLLQIMRQESHSISLLLSTLGFLEQLPGHMFWSFHYVRDGDPRRLSKLRSVARWYKSVRLVVAFLRSR